MNRYQRRSNPLSGIEPGTWQSDTPPPRTQPAKGWDDVDIYNPHSKENILATKATNIVRQRYRIPSGVEGLRRWQPHHDAEARSLFDLLMEGKPLPEDYRVKAKASERRDPATDPRSPRNWSRLKYGG